MKRITLVVLSLAIVASIVLTACTGGVGPQGQQGPQGPKGDTGPAGPGAKAEDIAKAVDGKFNTVDRKLALWNIQPGLGTVMIEYGTRFDNVWFAAQKGNWDMVKYQVDEMTEIQEVAEVTRPARQPMLKAFEDTYLVPLNKAAEAKDLAAFITAYDKAIEGCNNCHAASTGAFASYGFVKVVRPSEPHFENIEWAGQNPTLSANTLAAVKTSVAPKLDGAADDAAWANAKTLSFTVSAGANLPNGSTTVEMKAVYTADNVYFLAQWADPTQSLKRSPFQKQADGTWIKLKDPNDKGGDNNLYYEDKAALIWNINNSIVGFNEQGCMVTCHAGEAGKPFGNKYTAKSGEIGDIWHFKSVRTGPVGQVDDQYVDSTRYDATTAPEAGRKSDPKTGGGYADSVLENGKPKYAAPDNKPAPPYWLMDSTKVAFDDSKYKAGDEVASIIIAPFTGDRGDLTAGSAWKDGKWTLEWGRKLVTSSPYDVQFTSLDQAYFFGMAVFDNASVRHAYMPGANKLVFLK